MRLNNIGSYIFILIVIMSFFFLRNKHQTVKSQKVYKLKTIMIKKQKRNGFPNHENFSSLVLLSENL